MMFSRHKDFRRLKYDTKWCVIQKTKTKSEFAVKINTGANSGGSSEERNLKRLLHGLHAWQHALRNMFLSFYRLTSYYYIKNIHI